MTVQLSTIHKMSALHRWFFTKPLRRRKARRSRRRAGAAGRWSVDSVARLIGRMGSSSYTLPERVDLAHRR